MFVDCRPTLYPMILMLSVLMPMTALASVNAAPATSQEIGASKDGFPEKPGDLSPERWGSLKAAVQQARLLPSPSGVAGGPGSSEHFGVSVSVSGNRALVGGTLLAGTGAAIVFEDSGSGWTEVAVLRPSDRAAGDRFGNSVSLSGNRALVGAYLNDDNGSGSGSAYVFDFNGVTWTETSKLLASDGAASDYFGFSVSLSGDRALVGAYRDDDNGGNSGSAYVFDFNGVTWSETIKLLAADGAAGDQFGYSVSLSGDRALVGAYLDDDNGIDSGSAYVFDFNGVTWGETTKLTTVVGAAGDRFGYSVSLSGDRALIGTYLNDSNGTDSGIAFVFDFNGVTWGETFNLLPADGAAGDQFGYSVTLSGDRALVGAKSNDDNGSASGSAYVFDFNGVTWIETDKLLPADGAINDWFGNSVSLSGDSVLVGAYFNDDNGSDSGSAYVFDFNGASWSETIKLLPAVGAAFDQFGYEVSLYGDRALVGAIGDEDNGDDSGAAYVFDYDGANWNETTKLLPADGAADDQFGYSVSLFGDRALVGAVFDDDNGTDSGSAYVFDFNGVTWSETTKLLPADGSFGDEFGVAVSLSGDRALVGANLNNDNGSDSGSAYVFDFNGVAWSETTKLLPADGAALDRFGDSVSLSGDRALIGAPRNADNGSNSGSAYIFDFDGVVWSETIKLLPADLAGGDYFGLSVSLSGDRALIGAYFDDDNGINSGSAYVFDFNGVSWSETTKLLPADGAAFDRFGRSVSVSGDRALVGAYLDADNGADSGSAYLFAFNGASWNETSKLLPANVVGDRFGYSVSLSGDRALVGAYLDDEHHTDSGSAYVYLSVNQQPVAFDDAFDSLEDLLLNANVFGDNGNGLDMDPDGDSFEVQSPGVFAAGGIGGSVDLSANGDLVYTPALNMSGIATVDYTIVDPFGATDSATVTIMVQAVNDPPTFSANDPAAVQEDAGAQLLNNWATFDAGAPDEVDGVIAYSVSNVSNLALFAAGPTVDAAGILTFTPAGNGFGNSTFDVVVQDDGGVANGGIDTSAPQTFFIKVNPVNDQPTFTATDPAAVLEDAGAQSINNWAALDAGAPNETDAVMAYTVSNVANAALFTAGPAVDATGVLTFTPADDQFGSSTFDVIVQDDGGVANGGVDTSTPQTFSIMVNSVNDAPTFVNAGNVTEIEDGNYAEPWASSITSGPANESGQSVTFMTTVTSNPGLFAVGPTIDPTGTLTFAPLANTTGSATIEAVAMDNGGMAMGGDDLSDPAVFTIDVIAAADLTIDKTSGSFFTPPGGMVSYTIVITNLGPSDVIQAAVTDVPPARLGNVTWICSADPGATCSPSGSVEINELVNMPEGTSVTFELDATLLDNLNDPITNTAQVQTPAGVLELGPSNNTDSDTDLVGMFADSMESIER